MKTLEDYQSGQVLLIDKPLQWTSFQVVNKLRWEIRQAFKIKKIKVGHAGTLDPLATGLLILCTGKKTKEIESFMGLEKTYSGTITLGSTRPSFDMESEIDATFPTEHITEDLIKSIAKNMIVRSVRRLFLQNLIIDKMLRSKQIATCDSSYVLMVCCQCIVPVAKMSAR